MAPKQVDKTLAMKALEGKKIAYEVVTYPDTVRDAEEVAATLGLPAGQVFKTLVVVKSNGKPALIMIPADRQLDLKQVARALGEKKVVMAGHQEAEAITGLQVGGISALALLHRNLGVFLDQRAEAWEQIYVSAGWRGINLKIQVADLIKATDARLIDAV